MMTVKELREKLADFPNDAVVMTHDDCYGHEINIEVYEEKLYPGDRKYFNLAEDQKVVVIR